MANFDFCGWATRNDIKCSDGRTIRRDAFQHQDGVTVPLVWNHDHNDPLNVLGHALLENREEGVYAYCTFNDTPQGENAKSLVQHGDVTALSIYANKLRQNGGDVVHGMIRELSLVLAGANPGAFIETVMAHSESSEEEAVIYTGEELQLEHSEETVEPETEDVETPEVAEEPDTEEKDPEIAHADNGEGEAEVAEKTIKEIFDNFTEEQKTVVYAMVGAAVEEAKNEQGDSNMKHNAFENDEMNENVIAHSEIMAAIGDAKKCGSMKEAFIQHGIEDIETLFPEAKSLNNPPEWIKRDTGWVAEFMGAVSHSPFSRIKSMFADITEDDARAKGYIKGNMKKEEFFGLIKRSTTPTTVYKKQKLDRDDVIDITDFDVVAWLKSEMRLMLDEELARAMLIGDGRNASSDDKINEGNIRPILSDNDLFTVKKAVTVANNATGADKAHAFITAAIKARKDYKGSGNPTLYTTEDMLTEMLLLTDTTGRDLYKTEAELATKLRVKKIVTVEVMEGLRDANNKVVAGIIVNPTDYRVGADKGGAVNMFDDFDIDYNAQKYLIETRCSGALIKPYAALAFHFDTAA